MATVKINLPKSGFFASNQQHYRPDPKTGLAEVPVEVAEEIQGAKFYREHMEKLEHRNKAKSASERMRKAAADAVNEIKKEQADERRARLKAKAAKDKKEEVVKAPVKEEAK